MQAVPDIIRGTCHALFAYDIGFSIDLNEAERRIKDVKQRETIKHKRRAPQYFQVQPPPLRVTHAVERLSIGDFQTNATVDIVLYDFGWRVRGVRHSSGRPTFGTAGLEPRSSTRIFSSLTTPGGGSSRFLPLSTAPYPNRTCSMLVEDYAIFQIDGLSPEVPVDKIVTDYRQTLAQILRAETHAISEDEVGDAMSRRISFGDDLTVVDWNSAIVIDPDADDIVAILEFANVELMEMRNLDWPVIGMDALTLAYETPVEAALGADSRSGRIPRNCSVSPSGRLIPPYFSKA